MIFFAILILITCVLLGLIILVQNPKGGGLAGNVAGETATPVLEVSRERAVTH